MTRKLYQAALPLVLLLLFFTLTCQMDHGLEPIRSGISGTIKFVGEWPPNTAEVRIVAVTTFPPNDISDLIIGDVLPIGGDSTNYTFYLKPGEYYLGLVWRSRDSAWGIQSIFGIYFEPGETFAPGLITIPDERTIITGKNIVGDFSYAKVPSNSTISGKVIFNGTWPEHVEDVRVIVSAKIIPSSLLDLSFSGSIAAYVDSTEYSIPVAAGTYRSIIVLLKYEDQPWSLNGIASVLFKEINIPEEDTTNEIIDLTVNFLGN